jgi:ABC-2 type transport system permease protein
MSGREAVGLVARREIRERVREKSFLVSTGINVVLIVAVVILLTVIGGGSDSYTVGVADPAAQPVAEEAARAA